MSKTDATKRRKRQSKVVISEVGEEEDTTTTKIVGTESKDVEMEEAGDNEDSQKDMVIEVKGSTTTVTVAWEEKNEEQQGDERRTNTSEQMTDAVKGKRKAESTAETSPSKKTKLINDGFCLFVGNLNHSKKMEEIKISLANYFNKQSLLFQDIRLARSKKHAFVDLASEMDLTKALTLDGEMILDKPMRIAKAKVKSEDVVKVKKEKEKKSKKAIKNAKCVFLRNVPYTATEKDILKVFPTAIAVRFPGGTEGPTKGIAFLEFQNKTIANQVRERKQGAKIQDRVLIVDHVGKADTSKVDKAADEDNNTKAAAPPNNTLFVSNLSPTVNEKGLKKVFQAAVTITIPQKEGKSRGFAFVEFTTVDDAEKALESSQSVKIKKRAVKIQFCEAKEKKQAAKVLLKTLIVMGIAKETTAETLKSAFDGALSARVAVDKETGVSKGFGFVEFESEDNCKATKEAMEDCEIDGSKVKVAYARQKEREPGHPVASEGSAGRPGGQPAEQPAGGGKGGKGKKGKKGGKGAGKSKDGVKEVKNKG